MSLNLISCSHHFANAIFYFYSVKDVCLAVFTDSLFSLCACSLKNNTSVEKKRHVILMKTTRRFDENNTSF
jgi:hypothetical protein